MRCTKLLGRGKEPTWIFCLRMSFVQSKEKKIRVPEPGVVSTASCTFVGRGRKEIH